MKKRPIAPQGFVPFKWKSRRVGDTSVSICPNCGCPKHGEDKVWGYCYHSGGWTDQGAEKAFREGVESGIFLCGAGDPKISYEEVPILLHWSRFCEGECLECDCSLWHDFVDPWQYYYKPTSGQLSLF